MTEQPRKGRRGLGRGLGALIQSTAEPEDAAHDAELQVEETSATEEKVANVADSETVKEKSPGESLSERYLGQGSGQREKRRPSDLFFGGEVLPAPDKVKRQARASMPNPLLDRPLFEMKAQDIAEEQPEESTRNSLLRDIPVGHIRPNPRQPRDEFDEEAMMELVASISEVGVLQPVVVREVSADNYELIMGERRWRASQRAGLDIVPAIVRDTADEDLLREALLENIHRSELNALEEAAAYQQLMKDFGWTQDILAKRVGRSRPHISNTLRLMNLPPAVQRQVASGVLSAGHARAILGVGDEPAMVQLAQRVINEGLSVRATEELSSLLVRNQKDDEAASNPAAKRNTRQFDDMAASLTDLLDTQVKITLGAKKGRIAIDFASVGDLNRIMTVIGQDTPS